MFIQPVVAALQAATASDASPISRRPACHEWKRQSPSLFFLPLQPLYLSEYRELWWGRVTRLDTRSISRGTALARGSRVFGGRRRQEMCWPCRAAHLSAVEAGLSPSLRPCSNARASMARSMRRTVCLAATRTMRRPGTAECVNHTTLSLSVKGCPYPSWYFRIFVHGVWTLSMSIPLASLALRIWTDRGHRGII